MALRLEGSECKELLGSAARRLSRLRLSEDTVHNAVAESFQGLEDDVRKKVSFGRHLSSLQWEDLHFSQNAMVSECI